MQELEQKLAEKDAQLQEYVTVVHEAKREFEAMRARVRKEASRDAEVSRRAVFADLLEVIDNLDRALGGSARQRQRRSARAGRRTRAPAVPAQTCGVWHQPTRAAGDPFDPELHEAVTTVPVSETYGEGIVAGVAAPGYLIGQDVLRPAAVAVASAS